MQKIAIIPARGGSKRIPGKNIRAFHGKPIIAYSIEAAIRSELFDEIMVSTNDEEIASISRKLGAGVPFMRDQRNADDQAGLAEVMKEVLNTYNDEGRQFDLFCCILPTAPFLSPARLEEGYQLLQSRGFDSVIAVTPFGYPIERGFHLQDQEVQMIWPENYTKRSQDLPGTYHDTGQFYWMTKKALDKHSRLFTSNSGAIVLPASETQDIDDEEDWRMAEIKYEILRRS